MDYGVDAVVFFEDVEIDSSFSLPNECSVSQADILEIQEAISGLNALENIGIIVDIQVALSRYTLRAIYRRYVNFRMGI